MESKELHLPEGIIHCIMFHLNPKQRVKASLLSKSWLNGWWTYPELNFHYRYFDQEHCCRFDKDGNCSICKRDQQSFWNYMKGIMAKYHHHQDHHIRVFSFDMSHRHAIHRWAFHGDQVDDWSSFLDRQLQVALEKGLKDVRVIGKKDVFVPESILGAESLTSLSIAFCKFQGAQSGKPIMCNNIRFLHLKGVYIDDEMFRSFIVICPLINDLSVEECRGLNTIEVTDCPNLKKISLNFPAGLRKSAIKVDAPNVESIELHRVGYRLLELHPSKALKRLRLDQMPISDDALILGNMTEKFPNLEFLRVYWCFGFERINLRSHSLKHICLYLSGRKPVEVKIDAPNIKNVECGHGTILQNLCFRSSEPDLLKVTIDHFGGSLSMDTNWFIKFNELLWISHPSKVSIDLRVKGWFEMQIPTCADNAIEVEDLDLEGELESNISSREALAKCYWDLLRGLLWACRPKRIVLHPGRESMDTMAEFLYNFIMERSNQEAMEFWQHDLKRVEIEIYDKTRKEYCLQAPMKTFDSLRHSSKIVLKLQWNLNSSSTIKVQDSDARVED